MAPGIPQLTPQPPPIVQIAFFPDSRSEIDFSQVVLSPATKLNNPEEGAALGGGGDVTAGACATEASIHAPHTFGLAEGQLAPGIPQLIPHPPPIEQIAARPGNRPAIELSHVALSPATKLYNPEEGVAAGAAGVAGTEGAALFATTSAFPIGAAVGVSICHFAPERWVISPDAELEPEAAAFGSDLIIFPGEVMMRFPAKILVVKIKKTNPKTNLKFLLISFICPLPIQLFNPV